MISFSKHICRPQLKVSWHQSIKTYFFNDFNADIIVNLTYHIRYSPNIVVNLKFSIDNWLTKRVMSSTSCRCNNSLILMYPRLVQSAVCITDIQTRSYFEIACLHSTVKILYDNKIIGKIIKTNHFFFLIKNKSKTKHEQEPL